ncbi:MAG: hypothetical protein C4297_09860 [Gemmataceae bacterium]
MLDEQTRLLLAAYASGDVTKEACKRALHLTRQSEEARRFVRDLLEDQIRLRSLPAVKPSRDLTETILQRWDREAWSPAWSWWSARRMAAAAIVLVACCLSWGVIAWYGRLTYGPGQDVRSAPLPTQMAETKKQAGHPAPERQGQPSSSSSEQSLPDGSNLFSLEKLWDRSLGLYLKGLALLQRTVTEAIALAELDPVPDIWPADNNSATEVLTTRASLAGALASVDFQAPFAVVRLFELERQDLEHHLAAGGLFVVDLPASDSAQGLDRLIKAAAGLQLPLVLDGEVRQRLQRRVPSVYIVYAEKLSINRALGLFEALADTHNRDMFQTLFLQPAVGPVAKRCADLLGLSPETLMSRIAERRDGATLPDDTLRSLQKTAASKGASQPAPAGVVLVGYANRTGLAVSKSVREFFDQPPVRRDGTIHLVIVVRPRLN